MLSSTSTQESCDLQNIHHVNEFGISGVLQSAAIFGANGSGKSNFVDSLKSLKRLVLTPFDSVPEDSIAQIIPFLLKEDHYDVPTEFEVSFLAEGNLYRYGISITKQVIDEEWLYWTKTSRETKLFHRRQQTIEYNRRSFGEASLFVKKVDDVLQIEKTKPTVPFLSVLSQFDGERSNAVTDWFKKLNIISGINEYGFKEFTIKLFESDPAFTSWALEILKSLQIDDINIIEHEIEFPLPDAKKHKEDKDLVDVISTVRDYLGNHNTKQKSIEVIKKPTGSNAFSLPIEIESEGTRKLVYLLGPLYDIIQNDELLVVDEFDNKFHTLLSKFIITLYNHHNFGKSQLLLTCHDTNLLTNELFRRDQIWFIEKNEKYESQVYSLVEYKEHYTRKGKSFSKDYLLGKYGAIPLFSTLKQITDLLDGEK